MPKQMKDIWHSEIFQFIDLIYNLSVTIASGFDTILLETLYIAI